MLSSLRGTQGPAKIDGPESPTPAAGVVPSSPTGPFSNNLLPSPLLQPATLLSTEQGRPHPAEKGMVTV